VRDHDIRHSRIEKRTKRRDDSYRSRRCCRQSSRTGKLGLASSRYRLRWAPVLPFGLRSAFIACPRVSLGIRQHWRRRQVARIPCSAAVSAATSDIAHDCAMAAMGSRTVGARGAVGRRAASSTASLIRLRGVIIKSMGNAWSMSALQRIVLQNSFWTTEDKFSGLWVRRSNNRAGDHSN
jgi:hypothetical protein